MDDDANRERDLLPPKKRPLNYSSNAKRVDDVSVVAAETKDTAGALEASVPRRRRRTVPAAASWEPAVKELPAPAAASPEPAAEGNTAAASREPAAKELPAPAACSLEPAAEGNTAALPESDEEKKRLSKGKWVAKDESRNTLVTPQLPVKKLMHDGIRSFNPQQLRDEHRRRAAAAVPPSDGHSPALSVALERRLNELDATPPWLVLSKALRKSDVDVNQNRLLVSCKRGSGSQDCPITRCFSPAELERVNMKNAGLCVTAFDRGGSPYALTCKFLASNNGYRFITDWKKFLIQNGMDLGSQEDKNWKRDVEVELWAFRSRRLPFQPQVDAEGNLVTKTVQDEDVQVDQWESDHLHTDGALGLLLLHHEKKGRVVKSEEEEDDHDDDWKQGPSSSVARKKKGKQQSGKRKRVAAASPAPVAALPAPVAEQELLFCAAVGLEKLRQSISKQWQEYVDRGHGAKSSADVAKSSADVEEESISKKQKRPGTHSTKERGGEE